jgi:hypothetical protein
VFDNLGFDTTFVASHAIPVFAGASTPFHRTTVVAIRRNSVA